MTVSNEESPDVELDASTTVETIKIAPTEWIKRLQSTWGEPLVVPEWEDDTEGYRAKNGWQGRDLVHDENAPVRITRYFVQYGNGNDISDDVSITRGGVGTILTGVVVFTPRAESHQGYCHGGSMCSVMDDVVGWCSFLTTGRCQPWSGFTVQVNTSLRQPVAVNATLLVRAEISKIERRKVYMKAVLVDPANEDRVHAICDGMAVLNCGVLPLETQQSTDTVGTEVDES
jgi:acyl-coenzyme A thioesterase PaaI-like protein